MIKDYLPRWVQLPRMRRRGLLAASLLTLAVFQIACVGGPQQAPGKPYHHLANGQFRNPQGSPTSTATLGDMLRFFGRRLRDKAPGVPPDHRIPTDEAIAQLLEQPQSNAVTWLGHAAFLLHLDGKFVLTDPYLTSVAGPAGFGPKRYVAPGVAIDRLPPIDILLISHNHYDHLDAETIEALPGKDRIHVVVPLGLGKFFRQRGYLRVTERDWYEHVEIDSIEIVVLPAIHFSRRGPFDRNRTLWSSFSIRGKALSIYHSGDTAYHPQVFNEIGQRFGPFDLALVAIGAYEPRRIMESAHVTPEEAVQLIEDIRAREAVGMHWGTVRLTDEPILEPPQRFTAAARAKGWENARATVMRVGETRTLPGGF